MKILIVEGDIAFRKELFLDIDRYLSCKNIQYKIEYKEDVSEVKNLYQFDVVLLSIENSEIFNYIKKFNNPMFVLYSDDIAFMQNGYKYPIFRFIQRSILLRTINDLFFDILQAFKEKIFSFEYRGNFYKFKISDLFYIEVKGNYVLLTIDNTTYKIRTNARKFHFDEEYPMFISVDYSIIVNGDKVKTIDVHNQRIFLENSMSVSCSKRGIKDLKRYLQFQHNDKNM